MRAFGPRNSAYAFLDHDRHTDIYIYLLHTSPAHCTFSMTRSVRYQPIFNTLYYTLHTEHAYCLSYRFLKNVVITTVIEMVELVEILDRRLGKRSVERVRYVINNLLHLVIVKYGDISLVLCISTRLRLVTILSLLVKYLVIFHADPCNKSYIYHAKSRLNTPVWGSLRSPNYIYVVGMSRMSNHVESRESNTRMLKVSKIRPVTPILFVSSIR